MIRTILVPLDGSRFAESAIPVALGLARRAKASLKLVMAHEPAMAFAPAAGLPTWTHTEDPELRAREFEYLADTAAALDLPSGEITFELLEGEPGPALVEKLMLDPPDMVVMATHGRGAFSRFWLGSVADHVIRNVSVPVLLLRPIGGITGTISELGCRCVIVPVDLSPESEAALEPVKALARLYGSHLTLVHVVDSDVRRTYPYPVADPNSLEASRIEAQERLDGLAGALRAEGFGVNTRVLVGAGVAAQLLDLLDHGRYDLIALATHGATGLQRAMLGSVADKVIRGAEKPVLVVRPARAGT